MWETQRNNVDWDYFKVLILPVTWQTRNQHRAESCAFFGSLTFVPISWMCKKQTSVAHSSTEAEIISLDASLRMDGIPDLDHWNLVIEVFHCNQNQPGETKDSPARRHMWHCVMSSTRKKNRTKAPTTHDSSELLHIDSVPSNVKFSQSIAMLYVFEDTEAVIKMIIKGKSPTMRHVSKTHRVSLDWLFDRINLDPKIQIRYIDTQHPMADILTKGHFTRVEWNNIPLFVQHQPLQPSLLRQESQLAKVHHRKDGEKDARRIRREQDCG